VGEMLKSFYFITPLTDYSGYWGLLLGIEWPGCGTDHSPPSGAKVENAFSYISTHSPTMSSWHGA